MRGINGASSWPPATPPAPTTDLGLGSTRPHRPADRHLYGTEAHGRDRSRLAAPADCPPTRRRRASRTRPLPHERIVIATLGTLVEAAARGDSGLASPDRHRRHIVVDARQTAGTAMSARGIIIGAPRSGSGKTRVTIGLSARAGAARTARRAARNRDRTTSIPAFHAAATGLPGVNLDSWAMPPALLDALAAQAAGGRRPRRHRKRHGPFRRHSRAAGPLGIGGRSGAALRPAGAAGARRFRPVADGGGRRQGLCEPTIRRVRIAGVVLNRVGSERHRRLAGDAIERLGLPVVGAILRDPTLSLPERHLGLVQASEHADLDAHIDRLADMIERSLDLDAIRRCAGTSASTRSGARFLRALPPPGQRIALAQDAAFTFLYPHVLAAMARRRRRNRAVLAAGRRGPPMPTATSAGCRAAIRSCTPADWRPPRTFAPACGTSRRQGRSMASAAASWCLARAWRMPTASRHAMLGLLGHATSFAKRQMNLGYRQATIARRLSDRRGRQRSCAAMNSTTPG